MNTSTRRLSVQAIKTWVKENGKWSLLVRIDDGPHYEGDTSEYWYYVHTAKINKKSLEFYGQGGTSVELSGYQFSILPQFLDTVKWIMRDKDFWTRIQNKWAEIGDEEEKEPQFKQLAFQMMEEQ